MALQKSKRRAQHVTKSNVYSKSCSCITCTSKHKCPQTSLLKIIVEGSHNTFNIFKLVPTKKKKSSAKLILDKKTIKVTSSASTKCFSPLLDKNGVPSKQKGDGHINETQDENTSSDQINIIYETSTQEGGDNFYIDKFKKTINVDHLDCPLESNFGVSRGINCALLVFPTKNEEQQYATSDPKENELRDENNADLKITDIPVKTKKSLKFLNFLKCNNNKEFSIPEVSAAQEKKENTKRMEDIPVLNLDNKNNTDGAFYWRKILKLLFRKKNIDEGRMQTSVTLKKTKYTNTSPISVQEIESINLVGKGTHCHDLDFIGNANLVTVSSNKSITFCNNSTQYEKQDLDMSDVVIVEVASSIIDQKMNNIRKYYSIGHLDRLSIWSEFCDCNSKNVPYNWKCTNDINNYQSIQNLSSNVLKRSDVNINMLKELNLYDTYLNNKNIGKSVILLDTPVVPPTIKPWPLSTKTTPYQKSFYAMRLDKVRVDDGKNLERLIMNEKHKRRHQKLLQDIENIEVLEQCVQPGANVNTGKIPLHRKVQGHKKAVRALSSFDFNIEFSKSKDEIARENSARKRCKIAKAMPDAKQGFKGVYNNINKLGKAIVKDFYKSYKIIFPPKKHKKIATTYTIDRSTQKNYTRECKKKQKLYQKQLAMEKQIANIEKKLPKPMPTKNFPSKADVIIKAKQIVTGDKRQAVKLGSTFSLGLEFHKNTLYGTDVIQETATQLKKSKKSDRSGISRGVGAQSVEPCKDDPAIQMCIDKCFETKEVKVKVPKEPKMVIVKQPKYHPDVLVTKSVATKTMEKCFCTLKYNKEKVPRNAVQYIKNEEIMANYKAGQPIISRGIGKSKLRYECPPGYCNMSVGLCNSVLCDKKLQAKFERDNAPIICTIKKQKEPKIKSKKPPKSPPPIILPPKDLEMIGRDVQIGSKFSFNIEFFKDSKKEKAPQNKLKLNVKPQEVCRKKYKFSPEKGKVNRGIDHRKYPAKSSHATAIPDSTHKRNRKSKKTKQRPASGSASTMMSLRRCYCTISFPSAPKKCRAQRLS